MVITGQLKMSEKIGYSEVKVQIIPPQNSPRQVTAGVRFASQKEYDLFQKLEEWGCDASYPPFGDNEGTFQSGLTQRRSEWVLGSVDEI